jgi:hypothetical protein
MTHGTPRISPQFRPLGQSTTLPRQVLSILTKLGIRISILRKEYVLHHIAVLYLNCRTQYDPSSYPQPYMPEGGPSNEPSSPPTETTDPPRGRKRTRTQVNFSFCCAYFTEHSLAYSRSSGLCTGEPTQPQCAFSYAAVTGCQEYIRRESIYA